MTIAQIAYHWMDLIWLPIAFAVMERGKRLLTMGFVILCVAALRLQMELFDDLGFSNGYFGFMDSDIYPRGIATYAAFIAFFLFLAYFSKGADKNVHMAASISIFLAAFCISSIVMVL